MAGLMSPAMRQRLASPQDDPAQLAGPPPDPAGPIAASSADPDGIPGNADDNLPPDQGSGGADTVGDDAGQEQASPEEQAQKDAIVKAAFMLMYGGGRVRPVILQLLDNDPTDLKQIFGKVLPLDQPVDPKNPQSPTLWQAQGPIIALAATGVVIMLEVLKQMGGQLPDGGIILHAGAEIIEDLGHIAALAGKTKFTPADLAEALRKGADLFREAAAEAGMIDLNQVKAEFGQIVQADKAGQINKLLPGLPKDDGSQQGQQPAGGQQPQPGQPQQGGPQ
jgi:hypothetical protein